MSALPALTKTYSTRANVPFPDVTTTERVRQSQIFLLKAALMDQLATGTMNGSRNANSVWTCDHSCDGTTAGTPADGVDRWGGTFTPANIVRASTGGAHSWIVLRNVTSGLYLCIDCNDPNANLRIAVSKTSFSGGTTTAGPTATGEFLMGTTGTGNGSLMAYISDSATGNINYAHMVAADDGRFFFLVSRVGLGYFTACAFLIPSDGARVSDTNNWFAIGNATNSGRGSPNYNNLASSSGCVSRTPNGSAVVSTGGAQIASFGSTYYAGGYGVDSLTGDYLADPVHVRSLAPQVAHRGLLPDVQMIGTAGNGSSIPTAAAQVRIVAGDMVIPFTGTAPLI